MVTAHSLLVINPYLLRETLNSPTLRCLTHGFSSVFPPALANFVVFCVQTICVLAHSHDPPLSSIKIGMQRRLFPHSAKYVPDPGLFHHSSGPHQSTSSALTSWSISLQISFRLFPLQDVHPGANTQFRMVVPTFLFFALRT